MKINEQITPSWDAACRQLYVKQVYPYLKVFVIGKLPKTLMDQQKQTIHDWERIRIPMPEGEIKMVIAFVDIIIQQRSKV